MKTAQTEQIDAFLQKHGEFAECIIEELALKNYGTTFEVVFNYIWNGARKVRSNLDVADKILLKFHLVQELRINNSLTASMLENPELLNWGMNEIAALRVVSNSDSLRALHNLPVPFTHVAFIWEGDRRIDVIFSQLETI